MSDPVPFFSLGRLYDEQKSEIDQAVLRALGSGHFILGKECEAFEQAFAGILGAERRVVGCNSGTDALVLSLIAAGVNVGDEVICPSHTAIPTITAIRSAGGTPVFVDVDAKTWILSAEGIAAALTPRTKAVVCVHLYGNVVDIDAVQAKLAERGRTDVSIIEDVAQASGSSLRGKQAGTMGRFGAFSFYPTKNLGALGDAGAIAATQDDADRLKMFRNYGQKDRYNAEVSRGVNSRLDEVQAAVLRVRLSRLGAWSARKNTLVARYREELAGLPFAFQSVTPGAVPEWHLFVIATESNAVREALSKHLGDNGIGALVHYPHPTHLQKAFRSETPPSLPVTEGLASRILSLPMNPTVTDAECANVIGQVRSFFGS